jgi:hypothetical protein
MKRAEHFPYWNFFHPFELVGYRNDGDLDGKNWGLDLDLRTTVGLCHYEYGWIFTLRILGFGFEFSLLEI